MRVAWVLIRMNVVAERVHEAQTRNAPQTALREYATFSPCAWRSTCERHRFLALSGLLLESTIRGGCVLGTRVE
jgi:hypothetical protein